MRQRIFILGASGNVGRELIKQIVEKDGVGQHANSSEIVGVASSKNYIFSPNGIASEILVDIASSRENAVETISTNGEKIENLLDLVDLVKAQGMNGEVVFADVTAGKQELLNFHKKVITESGNFLVTANKNPISLFSMDDFIELTSFHGRYDTNTTVMGGAGVLNFVVERSDKINDEIKKIEGMFSGTLGYILSELEKGKKPFSEIVRDAKEQGYTEPNPWDDLNGLDVARKLIILARYSGIEIEIADVQVEPLVGEKYSEFSGDDFLNALKDEDEYFNSELKKAKAKDEVLRYVGEMVHENGKTILKVGLKSVPKQSDLGTLGGTSNLAVVETDILANPLPHVIKSRGAGLGVTAGAVRVGIAKMLPKNLITR